ncbi:hypothetical protein Taro_031866 [Colocasia esculenta]|uniref:Uncharacterized protein n=1 Tax=Colocasia esculenta TaxID=4460 RepID=A0A843W267_COLES|nr:hypothetical protein [Colocasia esculenta]
MDHNGAYGASWADQWDYGEDPAPPTRGNGGGSEKSKSSAAMEKTKAIAATGVNKVKHRASLGVRWIKEKYDGHKRSQKN